MTATAAQLACIAGLARELSEIAGMPEREVGDLMKAAVGNGKRLRACAGHRFVSAVARGPREDEGVAVFAEGSVPPPAEMGLLTWHRKEEIHGG